MHNHKLFEEFKYFYKKMSFHMKQFELSNNKPLEFLSDANKYMYLSWAYQAY